uniref:Uncharacterized protein n=1 Tax=Anopheles coluzzii TaxID=1518534 RepID=A0A8W7PRP7_ANOCL
MIKQQAEPARPPDDCFLCDFSTPPRLPTETLRAARCENIACANLFALHVSNRDAPGRPLPTRCSSRRSGALLENDDLNLGRLALLAGDGAVVDAIVDTICLQNRYPADEPLLGATVYRRNGTETIFG